MLYLQIIIKGFEFRDQNLIDQLIQAIKEKLHSSLSELYKNLSQKKLNKRLAQMVLSLNEPFAIEDVMELIILGANPNLIIESEQFPEGAPVLQCIHTYWGMVTNLMYLLIIYGLNPNTVFSSNANYPFMLGGETALLIAAECSLDTMELLINFGADLNAPHQPDTFLNYLVLFGKLDHVKLLLLKYKADVNAHMNRPTPLCNALTMNNYEMVEILLNMGADIYIGNTVDYFLLHQRNDSYKKVADLILRKYPELAGRIKKSNESYNNPKEKHLKTLSIRHESSNRIPKESEESDMLLSKLNMSLNEKKTTNELCCTDTAYSLMGSIYTESDILEAQSNHISMSDEEPETNPIMNDLQDNKESVNHKIANSSDQIATNNESLISYMSSFDSPLDQSEFELFNLENTAENQNILLLFHQLKEINTLDSNNIAQYNHTKRQLMQLLKLSNYKAAL